MLAPGRIAGVGLVVLGLLGACSSGEDARFLTPATTFAHYRQALSATDGVGAWACLAPGYRQLLHADDPDAYHEFLASPSGRRLSRQVQELQILHEVEINDRIGYLEFDPSTVLAGQSRFYYFLRLPQGWQITTHLDSVFRAELEAAVERGEFVLPGPG